MQRRDRGKLGDIREVRAEMPIVSVQARRSRRALVESLGHDKRRSLRWAFSTILSVDVSVGFVIICMLSVI